MLARLLVRQGRLSEHISENYDVPHSLLSQGLTLARQQQLSPEIAQALMGLGILSLVRGNLEEADVYLHQCLDICEEADLPWVRASALVMVAWLRSGEREWQAAEEACREAIAIHRQRGDENGVASALTALGNVYAGRGQFEEAEEAYGEALAICRQSGHRIGEGQALTGLFNVCYYQEKLARAAGYARESLAVSRDVGDRLGTAIAYHNLGFLAAKGGRHREAVEHYHQTLAIYGAMDADGTRHSNTHRYLAESLLALGQTGAAAEHVYRAIQLLPQAAIPQRGADLLLTAARLLQQHDDEELASGIVRYLQQQGQLPEPLEPALSTLLREDGSARSAPILSDAQGLATVRDHLTSLLDTQN